MNEALWSELSPVFARRFLVVVVIFVCFCSPVMTEVNVKGKNMTNSDAHWSKVIRTNTFVFLTRPDDKLAHCTGGKRHIALAWTLAVTLTTYFTYCVECHCMRGEKNSTIISYFFSTENKRRKLLAWSDPAKEFWLSSVGWRGSFFVSTPFSFPAPGCILWRFFLWNGATMKSRKEKPYGYIQKWYGMNNNDDFVDSRLSRRRSIIFVPYFRGWISYFFSYFLLTMTLASWQHGEKRIRHKTQNELRWEFSCRRAKNLQERRNGRTSKLRVTTLPSD